jgi:hypothetical protein
MVFMAWGWSGAKNKTAAQAPGVGRQAADNEQEF